MLQMTNRILLNKKAPTFQSRLCVRVTYLSGQAKYCDQSAAKEVPLWDPCVKTCLWHVLARKNLLLSQEVCVRVTYLPGQAKYCSAVKKCPVDTSRQKKPRLFSRGFVFALPIFPGSHPPSIVGANELNFCVRDGNRWTLIAINTNYIGKSIFALTFFLVTRTGFEPMLTA